MTSRVLDDVVDQPAGDGDRVELQVGEDLRDLDAVRDVRLAGVRVCPAMRRLAEPVGAREQVGVEPLVPGESPIVQPGMISSQAVADVAIRAVLPPIR